MEVTKTRSAMGTGRLGLAWQEPEAEMLWFMPREEPVAKGLTPSSGSTQPDTHSVASQRSVGVPPHPGGAFEAPGSTQREMGH